MGYNGLPRAVQTMNFRGGGMGKTRWGNQMSVYTVHSELNAILNYRGGRS